MGLMVTSGPLVNESTDHPAPPSWYSQHSCHWWPVCEQCVAGVLIPKDDQEGGQQRGLEVLEVGVQQLQAGRQAGKTTQVCMIRVRDQAAKYNSALPAVTSAHSAPYGMAASILWHPSLLDCKPYASALLLATFVCHPNPDPNEHAHPGWPSPCPSLCCCIDHASRLTPAPVGSTAHVVLFPDGGGDV